jgi:hypothetical protein
MNILLCQWCERCWWGSIQVIRCILCHNPPILEFDSSTKESKGLITHYKTYQITTLRKHVDVDHFIMWTKIEEEVNNAIRRIVEKQPTRRGLMCKSMQYFLLCCERSFQTWWLCNIKTLYKTLVFWLWKVTYLFNLCNALGLSILFFTMFLSGLPF